MNVRFFFTLALTLLAGLACLPARATLDPALVSQVVALDAQSRDPAAFTIYVGSARDELRLRRVTLRIDDLAATSYEYAEPEWEALAAGSVHAALTQTLAPGAHRLRLELFARTLDAGPGDARAVQRLDQSIDVQPGAALHLELRAERFGKSALAVTPISAGERAYTLRAAQFWLDAGRPLHAARLLMQGPQDVQAQTLLARSVQSFAGTLPAAVPAQTQQLVIWLQGLTAGDAQSVLSLETFGSEEPETEAGWILRDRANTALGYQHLRAGRAEQALETLARVRSNGAQGTEALLAFGWAFVQQQDRAPTHDEPARRALRQPRFVMAAHAPELRNTRDRRKALERALVPWIELVGRDPLDAHAQEGMLALAWALDQLGTGTQAHQYFERAAAQLENARILLGQASAEVREGRAAQRLAKAQREQGNGWQAALADLPWADDSAWFRLLFADASALARIDDYLAASALQDALGERAPQSALANAVQASEQTARAAFEREAQRVLTTQRLRTESYLAEARLALARHYDRALEPEVEVRRAAADKS